MAGISAALATVAIWAGFMVSLRFAMTSAYSPGALMLMRFVPAALILAPFLWRIGLFPKGLPLWQLLVIISGSGVPFYLLMSQGLVLSTASEAGALAPGTLPLVIALASFLLLGERFSRMRLAGFALILGGGLLIGLWDALSAGGGAWRGHLLVFSAASMWAVYTVIFRMSNLSALEGAALSVTWSALISIPFALIAGVSTDGATWLDITIVTLIQGVLAGALALVTYGQAVRLLGASRTAAFTALTPVLILISGVLILGEQLDAVKIIGIFIVSFGVFLASGVIERAPAATRA